MTDLTETQKDQIVTGLKAAMADTYALYVKTHGYHWNVTGPNFRSLHLMFEEQYNDLWAALDDIAERIRALGAYAPGSTEAILDAATIKPDNGVPDASSMVVNLANGHEMLAATARKTLETAEEAGDDVTEDLMTARRTFSDTAAWMLRSSQ